MMRRRSFLKGAVAGMGSAYLSGCSGGGGVSQISGQMMGASHAIGHLLRDMKALPTPTRTIRTDVLVAGAGMSGLMAALRLHQAGVADVAVLDLEAEIGGNSRYGTNATTAYPWAAHYVPLPGKEAVEVRKLFEELGVITGYDAAGRPQFEETFLCADPGERLYVHGLWQEGLAPTLGASPADLGELRRFHEQMDRIKQQAVFRIPVDRSSTAPEWQALDLITMEAWLQREGYQSERLRWMVDYGCRDDYGAGIREVSAWAGLHYFASRDEDEVLTWPAGNGWLVQQMQQRMPGVRTVQAVVLRMSSAGEEVTVDTLDPITRECVRWVARAAICALPRFVAQRLIPELAPIDSLVYSPWVVANLTWSGVPSATWDNVFYQSRSLGYVVATHQSLNPYPQDSVLTWYQPLDDLPPQQARQKALDTPWEQWRDLVLADMRPAHPDAASHISKVDVMLWGHGMIRPIPGFISSAARQQMAQPMGRIAFAHTDMSGISIFEEACTRGAAAAQRVLHWLKG